MPGFDGLSLAKHAGIFMALLVLSGCSLCIGDSDEQAVKEVPAQGRQFPVYTVSAPLAPTATPQHATVNSSDESASTETGQAEASANEAGGPDIYVVKSGDSLTSISAALGIAEAQRRQGDTARAVAIIGDGAATAAKTYLPGYDGGIDGVGLVWLLFRLVVALYFVASALSRYDRARLSRLEILLRLAIAVLVLWKTPLIAYGAIAVAVVYLAYHHLIAPRRQISAG